MSFSDNSGYMFFFAFNLYSQLILSTTPEKLCNRGFQWYKIIEKKMKKKLFGNQIGPRKVGSNANFRENCCF